MVYKRWSSQEKEYLESYWGVISLKGIATNLNRSVETVKKKAQQIGLSDPKFSFEGITLHQLSKYLNMSYSAITGWVKKHEFPAKKKLFGCKSRIWVVKIEDFWDWAEKHKQFIDFNRFEKNSLGPEPDWTKAKRNADEIKVRKVKKSLKQPWTSDDDNILKGMLNAYKYTYPEISQRLGRSEAAIKRRVWELGIKARPLRFNNHIKYTEEEIKSIICMIENGHCLEDIASRINKSAQGVRGKLERMGYRFKNGVPIKKAE